VFGSATYEYKNLNDKVGQFLADTTTKVSLLRLGVLGNHSDRSMGGAGTSSFALSLAPGNASLSPDAAALDALPSGPHVAGNFLKVNLELQRVQFLSASSSVLLSFAGQYASKNLVSAEKFYLGGPQGVTGYAIGEGVGDEGFTFAAEYRYLTGLRLADEDLSLTAFYNYGWIRRDVTRNATTLNTATNANTLSLDSAGVGLLLGREGNYVVTGALASRLGGPPPSPGQKDPSVRLWFTLQKWF
jgi:hemolysin activation/secretion protein